MDVIGIKTSPLPAAATIMVYLWFVLHVGPKFMAAKRPFELKSVILIYNAAMVTFSSWWVIKVVFTKDALKYFYRTACKCAPEDENKELETMLDEMNWYYVFSKSVELLDTVFFVLRKKQSQVTFLHVYHHGLMIAVSWFNVKYLRATTVLLVTLSNSFVHVVMYLYYFLAACGPTVQKYLFWKKYITKLQMTQFVIIITYLIIIALSDCQISSVHLIVSIASTSSFLCLFVNFYNKSYNKNEKTK